MYEQWKANAECQSRKRCNQIYLENYSEFNVENRKEISESGYGETIGKEAISPDQEEITVA